jgi:hypothetical protein
MQYSATAHKANLTIALVSHNCGILHPQMWILVYYRLAA